MNQKGYGYSDQQYAKGELVLYKDPINGRWIGRGRVLKMEENILKKIRKRFAR